MSIKYQAESINISVQVGDVDGDFIGSLNDAEIELCMSMLKEFIDCFVNCILIIRTGKESQDELEGKDKRDGRG